MFSSNLSKLACFLVVITLGTHDVHGKKPDETITGDLIFRDSPTDRIGSDGNGTYFYEKPSTGATINRFHGSLFFNPRERAVFMDFSDCVGGEDCETPFDPVKWAYQPDTHWRIYNGLSQMSPGETKTAGMSISFSTGKDLSWQLAWPWLTVDDPAAVTVTAYDSDGDGQTDEWVVDSPQEAAAVLTKWEGKGIKTMSTDVGTFYMPFRFTFAAD